MRPIGRLFVACAGLVASWLAARLWLGMDARFSDVPLYRDYGEAMAAGGLPYRDVPVEYPPAALPFFWLPAAVSSSLDGFRLGFEAMLLACGLALLVATETSLRQLGTTARHTMLALALIAAAPLLLGRVAFERYDLWPTTLVAVAVAFALCGRWRWSGAALGLGVAAKLFPLAFVPLVAAAAWRARGRREAVASAAIALGVASACFLPFVAVDAAGALEPVRRQLERPLQVESLGASLLLAAHQAADLSVGIESSYGSLNLGGTSATLVAGALSLALAVLFAALCLVAARHPPDAVGLVVLAAATAASIVALGKVLSPQFLLWPLPLVVLVAGRRGAAAWGLLAGAMLVTHVHFPDGYVGLVRLEAGPTWLLLVRDALLVALAVVLLDGARRHVRQPPVSPR